RYLVLRRRGDVCGRESAFRRKPEAGLDQRRPRVELFQPRAGRRPLVSRACLSGEECLGPLRRVMGCQCIPARNPVEFAFSTMTSAFVAAIICGRMGGWPCLNRQPPRRPSPRIIAKDATMG